MKNLKVLFSLFFLNLFGFIAVGQLRLPNFFSSNMVLQRDTEANIWGWGNAGENVRIVGSWNNTDTVNIIADANGKWRTVISTGSAGGPYKIKLFSSRDSLVLDDVLLGDVFLCSGQSNMEWGGNQNLKEILDELPYANNDKIRLLQVNRNGANAVQENITNSWNKLSASTLKPFSAIGYFIAKELNAKEGIPIGIINSSWGGTAAEVWTPRYAIEREEELMALSKFQEPNKYRPHEISVLWNSMIAPLTGMNLKGFYWYQGESNVGSWVGYNKLITTMVNEWRSAWNENIPFYFVQIAPFTYNSKNNNQSALLREQQALTALSLPNSGMVVITDLVDDIKDIHPIQKREVAHRLATLTLAEIYNKEFDDYKSPIYKSFEIKQNKIEISFHYLKGGLRYTGKEIEELFICGEDRVFHKAEAKISDNKLIVYSKKVKKPIAVRFAFSDDAIPNLFNKKGLPVSPFRTDDW